MLVLISQEVHMYTLLDHTMMNEKGLHYKCWSDVLVTFNILSIYVGNEGIFLIICDLITSCMSSYNTCAKGKRANDAEGVPP